MEIDASKIQDTLIEALKIIATIAIPYIALLRTRVDFDRYAAAQRAKASGASVESELRRKWYSKYFKKRMGSPAVPKVEIVEPSIVIAPEGPEESKSNEGK